jgi:polysaccharide biosynthesis transport protein
MFEAPRQIRPVAVGAGDVGIGIAPLAQIDFGKLLAALWRGKWTIALATLAALLLALVFIAVAPRQYTAATQILIDPSDLLAVGNGTTPAAPLSDAGLLQVESQVRVLSSDAVLRRVVTALDLDKDTEFAGTRSPLRALGRDILGLVGLHADATSDDKTLAALTELKRRVVVKRDERTYVVEVDVTTRSPDKSARIANAIADAYLAEQTQIRADAARQVSQSLSGRLKDLRDRLREAEEKVEDYRARNNMIGANGQLISEQQLSAMNAQLVAARARIAEAKGRLDQVTQVQRSKDENGAFPAALLSPTITALRTQYAEVMRREAEETTTLGLRHPAVLDIQAQADRLRHMIDNEIDRTAVAARTEYESAKASEETIANNLKSLENTTVDTNQAMVGLRELEREAQASRDIYQAFLVRARETGEQQLIDTKNIRVISRADTPLRRSSPPPNILIALGAMMLGAAAGCGIVLGRPQHADAAARPGRRSAGRDAWRNPWHIPWRNRIGKAAKDTAKDAVKDAVMGFWQGGGSLKIPVLAVLPAVDVSFGLSAVDDPKSPFAKGILKVYDALQSSHDRQENRQDNPSVLVVALDAEDDSATVALTLAALAAEKERVLLIDADIERRTLSALDAQQGEAGLVDVATGRRLLSDVITRDRETNINLVSFVSPDSRRDGRIRDDDIRRAFDQTKRFDFVIVAAIDITGAPSTRFFGKVVDHIVVVAKAGEHDETAVTRLIARLGLDADKVRGAVLTGADT